MRYAHAVRIESLLLKRLSGPRDKARVALLRRAGGNLRQPRVASVIGLGARRRLYVGKCVALTASEGLITLNADRVEHILCWLGPPGRTDVRYRRSRRLELVP